jgi:cobaltochelatase CobN
MSSIDEFIGSEFRSRYVNPTWIEGMKKEGYAGAGAMREFVEYLWGWDATVTETIDDAMWQETFEVYVRDKHGLDLEQFFDEKSPFAFQDIAARMLETTRKGYWQADAETRATLVREYLESVAEHGVGCSDNTCGNPRLLEYVVEQARAANVPAPDIAAFVAAVERATGAPIAELAAAAREFVATNEARLANRAVPGPSSAVTESVDAAELRGYLMQSVKEPDAEQSAANESVPSPWSTPRNLQLLALAVAVLGVLLFWRHRRRVA